MARQPRLILPNQPHLVAQCGNDRQPLFRDDEDHQRFHDWLKECARLYKVAIHAWVCLPERVVLLATPSDEAGLGAMMQKVGRHYVPWFNAKYGRTGTLFQGRFRTSPVEAGPWLLACIRHLETLPVQAGLATVQADYRWSSYAHHAGLRADALVTDHALFWRLGNTPFQREAAYTALVDAGAASDETSQIDQALAKGWPVASHAFKVELEKKTQRQILPAKRGRPRKIVAAMEQRTSENSVA